MARLVDRHPDGPDGDWFVDTGCIDCDAARQVAPGLIVRNPDDGLSVFTRQPDTPEEIELAWRATMVCPTRSVGHVRLRRPDSPVFPHDLGDGELLSLDEALSLGLTIMATSAGAPFLPKLDYPI